MARPVMLLKRPALTQEVSQLLAAGVPIVHACEKLGFSDTAFYQWKDRGTAELKRRESAKANPNDSKWADAQLFVEFLEAVTRAEAESFANAAIVIRQGMLPQDIRTEASETFSETRLTPDGKPYIYTRTVSKKSVTHQPGDWRAAETFLKRRDPERWSEHYVHSTEDEDGARKPLSISIIQPPMPPPAEDRRDSD